MGFISLPGCHVVTPRRTMQNCFLGDGHYEGGVELDINKAV